MTILLERAIETARGLPSEVQDELARAMLRFADDAEPHVDLTSEEEEAVLASKAAAARDEFATDEQIQMIWAKHGA